MEKLNDKFDGVVDRAKIIPVTKKNDRSCIYI